MKKYRLIKELPFENSPKIGYISKPKNGELHYYNHNWFNQKDYPEFWEEVIEKDYDTILMNEPCLSINDVYSIINGWSPLNKLKELVQSRLENQY